MMHTYIVTLDDGYTEFEKEIEAESEEAAKHEGEEITGQPGSCIGVKLKDTSKK